MKKILTVSIISLIAGSLTACAASQSTSVSNETVTCPAAVETTAPQQVVETTIPVVAETSVQIPETAAPVTETIPAVSNELPVTNAETSAETLPATNHETEILSIVETQMQAVKDNDLNAFLATIDTEFLKASMIADNEADEAAELDRDLPEEFNELCREMSGLQQMETIQGSLSDIRLKEEEYLPNSVKSEYTIAMNGSPVRVECKVCTVGEQISVMLEGWDD